MRNGDFNAVQSAVLGFDMIEMTWLSAFLIGAGCLALGCLIGARHSSRAALRLSKDAEIKDEGRKKINRGKQPLEVEKLAEIIEDFKMVLHTVLFIRINFGRITGFEFMVLCVIEHVSCVMIVFRFWL